MKQVKQMTKVLLGDVVKRVKDKVNKTNTDIEYYIGGEHFDCGEVTISRKGTIQGSTIGPAFHMRFKPGHVLLMSRNPHLRKACRVDFEGICSDVSYVCETKDESILKQSLLPFIFQTDHFWSFAESNKKGSTNFFLNWTDFERYEFSLPEMKEQEELAELLWAANDTKEAYKKLLSLTDDLVKSQFIEMFGDCIFNDRKWPVKPLCDVLAEGRTVTYGIVQTEDDTPGGVPVFRPVDISQGHIPTRNELKRTRKEISDKYKRTLLNGNELLITVRGSIGETFQTSEEFAGCNVARNIVPLVSNREILNQGFLKAVLDSPAFQLKLAELTKGVALKGINMGEFKLCPIILPPMELQEKCFAFIQESDKSKFELQQTIISLEATIKSLMLQYVG